MEFDINLILVPVTLVLLAAYIADKLVLKQHKPAVLHHKSLADAEKQAATAKQNFQEVLTRLGYRESPEEFIVNEQTPDELKDSYSTYQQARLTLAQVQTQSDAHKEHALVRWAYEYLPILLIIVIVRSFAVQPFNIPSSSMVPSLYTGDFILVNKNAYGLRLPLIDTKILNTGEPKHGDVVVFRYPENPKRYYIKRMIGLPGDTVVFDNGVLSINGEKVATEAVSYQMDATLNAKIMPELINNQKLTDEERRRYGAEEEKHARYYQETLGEHHYRVRYLGDLNMSQAGGFLNQVSPDVVTSEGRHWTVVVPEGQYFVMGDNRDRSEDSRFWGFVPEANLAGKATYIWMHKEPGLKIPSFDRVGKID